MKYVAGTITITAGSNVITGAGTNWASADYPWLSDPSLPTFLSIPFLATIYRVIRVNSDTELLLGRKFRPLPGAVESISGVVYGLATDFTASYGLPMPRQGDIDKGGMMRRALEIIDTNIATLL